MGFNKEDLGKLISAHPVTSASSMSFIVAGATALVVSSTGVQSIDGTFTGNVSAVNGIPKALTVSLAQLAGIEQVLPAAHEVMIGRNCLRTAMRINIFRDPR